MSEDERLTGQDLRTARLERRMTIARLAQLVDVDPRTVGRWESADYVPETAVPVLRTIFRFPDDATDAQDADAAHAIVTQALRDASHMQLLGELARRLEQAPPGERRFPDLPQTEVTWYSEDAPSSRRITKTAERDEPRQSSG